jgi:hypothetical protein
VFPLSFFNFVVNSKVRCCNLALTCSVEHLVEGVELRPFNYSKGEVLYNNKRNQSFSNNCYIKIGFKDLNVKVLSVPTCFSLAIKLFNLLVHSLLVLT